MFGDLPRAPHLITGEARYNDEPNSPMCRQSDAKLSSNLSSFKISLFVASPVPCGLPAFHINNIERCDKKLKGIKKNIIKETINLNIITTV